MLCSHSVYEKLTPAEQQYTLQAYVLALAVVYIAMFVFAIFLFSTAGFHRFEGFLSQGVTVTPPPLW